MNKDRKYLIQYWGYLKQSKWTLGLGMILIPLITVAHLLQPLLVQHGIDANISHKDLHGLYLTSFIFCLSVIAEFGFKSLQGFIFQYIGLKTVRDIRQDLFEHVLQFAPQYFDKTPIGVTTTRLTNDIESLNDSFTSGLVTLIGDILTLVGILIAMYWLSPRLTGVTLLVVPPLILMVNFFRIRLRESFNLIRTTMGRISGFLQEQLQGVYVVQLFSRIQRNFEECRTLNKTYRSATIHSVTYDALLYSFIESLNTIVICVVIWYGWGRHLQVEGITIGVMVAFVDYIQKFFNPLKELSNKFAVLQHALAALEKIFGLFEVQEKISSGTLKAPDVITKIRFKDVGFTYPSHPEKTIVSHVNFELEAGKVIAVVGPTGSGKSTLGRLLTRLYDGYTGSITLNETEITSFELLSLRRQISTVTQDVYIFSDTVAFNISLGNPDISFDDIQRAAQAVQIEPFILSLPQGYETPISQQQLSLGQAQLISFARVLASKAPIVMLDEATASVDSLSENKIQSAIETLLQVKTVLVIAHRLSTIQKADLILALKDGKIIEKGSHQELIAAEGFYHKLYYMQFQKDSDV